MEDLVESLTRGNAAEVKVLLASVALALGLYQLVVIAVGYGKLRLPFLAPPPAFAAHRAVGDTIALLLVCTGVMCVSVFGRFLPLLGISVFVLLCVTWATSAGGFLA
jgi:hypothetical protein